MYRKTRATDKTLAAEYAKKAAELLLKAPTVAGKKRLMARQLPFDVFVTRKVSKWEARAKEWKVDLVDAVGVDPIEEMIFFWNGHDRMTTVELEACLGNLAWSESDANETRSKETEDERAGLNVLRAAILRALRRHAEAKEILAKEVLPLDRTVFKGHLRDDWILPVAHFEMATNLWMERPSYRAAHKREDFALKATISRTTNASSLPSDLEAEQVERQKVRECAEHVETVAKWESFDLDTRIGLKVTAAQDAVRKWEAVHSATASDST